MAVTDISQIKQHKRAQKLKKLLKKLLVLIIVLSVIATVYFTRSLWYPMLDGIAGRLPSVSQGGKNSGELAEGNFPIKITGGTAYQVGSIGSSLMLLADTHYYIYDLDGKLLSESQHTYANPVMSASDKRAIIYDLGGNSIRLVSKNSIIYEKTLDDVIIFARLSGDGHCAVVTKSDTYLAVLTVFDSTGKEIFYYKSYDGRITDVAFTLNGDGCIINMLDARGGQLISTPERFRFTEEKPVWTGAPLDTMTISTVPMYDGTIVAVGDTKCAYYDKLGVNTGCYEYKYDLIGYSCSNELTALLFSNEERRHTRLVLISDITAQPTELDIDEASHVFVERSCAYILDDKSLTAYSASGEVIDRVELEAEYNNFHRLENYIYLLGYDEINRIDFSVMQEPPAQTTQSGSERLE